MVTPKDYFTMSLDCPYHSWIKEGDTWKEKCNKRKCGDCAEKADDCPEVINENDIL
jgi:hypothetical protein